MKPDYASAFRQARKTLGLSQEAFAVKLGVTQSCLSKIETDELTPSDMVLLRAMRVEEREIKGHKPITAIAQDRGHH